MSLHKWQRGLFGIVLIFACGAFDLFKSENGDVKSGNEAMAAGKLEDAVASYRRALRQLPDERGISLNLGIALGKLGEHEKSIQSLEQAAESQDPSVRAQALYNLGNQHFATADKVKEPKSPEEMKARMEGLADAAAAYKRSLTLQVQEPVKTRVGTLQADTRWNLELTLREMKRDEEKRQQEQQQQGQNGQQPQNGQNGQNGQQPGQNGQQPGQQPGQNGQQPGQNGQNGQQPGQQPGQNGQQPGQNGQQPGQNGQQPGQNGQQPGQNGQQPGQNGQQPGQQPGQNGQNPGQQPGPNGQPGQGGGGNGGEPCDPSKEICGQTPGDAILDALERSERNLQLERARQKQNQRRPVKDW